MKLLFSMLDDMIAHFNKTRNKSTLTRIYGVYTIKTKMFVPVNFMVMQNIFNTKGSYNHKVMFDLKGSCFKRYTLLPPEEDKFWRQALDQKRVLMEANFLEIKNEMGQDLVKLN